jgi:inward rectifier potassium channel|nr:ion channel [Kofleriaceae bacterium]
MAKPKAQQFFDARGRSLIERRGLESSIGASLANDAYHLMRSASWTAVTAAFFGMFVLINVIFALILDFGGAHVANAHGFVDDFWFSVQTLGTIGYGGMSPDDTLSNTVVTIESFVGMVLSALITGVFFARFSTPTARVIFSKVAVIADHDGKRALMFRMANARATAIVEATARVYVTRDELLASGERVRRIYDLPLRRANSPNFNLSWVAYHDIEGSSPLVGATLDDMRQKSMNIIVTFQGIDDRLAQSVHTRWVYMPEDLRVDHKFVDIFATDAETGRRYLDFVAFHDTTPLAGDPAAPG